MLKAGVFMAEKKSLSRRTFIKGAMGFAGLAALGAGVSFLPRTELMRTIENKNTVCCRTSRYSISGR